MSLKISLKLKYLEKNKKQMQLLLFLYQIYVNDYQITVSTLSHFKSNYNYAYN